MHRRDVSTAPQRQTKKATPGNSTPRPSPRCVAIASAQFYCKTHWTASAQTFEATLADLGKPEVIPGDFEHVRVNCKVTVGIDAAKYKKLQDRMVYVPGAAGQVPGYRRRLQDFNSRTAEPHKNAVALLRRRFLTVPGPRLSIRPRGS